MGHSVQSVVPNFGAHPTTIQHCTPPSSSKPLPLQALLLLARMLLLPLPLKHRLWVQTAEIRAALARLARQPASTACCDFVNGARSALDTLVAHGAPLRPTPLGIPPTAAQCCWMARTFSVLLIGAVLPIAAAVARTQHAAAWAAWVQAAMLRGCGRKRGSRGTGSSPGKSISARSSSAASVHRGSPNSPESGGSCSLPNGSPSSSVEDLPEGSPAGNSGRLAGSASASTACTTSLDQPGPYSSSSSGGGLASSGRTPSDPSAVGCSRSGSSGKLAAARASRRRSSPGGLSDEDRPSPRGTSSSPRSSAAASLASGHTLAGLPAALLSAPLPLTWLQCLFLLLPASAALWAALEVAVNTQRA